MGYYRMTDNEREAFLREPVRPGILATTRSDGRPHATPVWYDFDGDEVVFTTGANTVKGRNLSRNARVALCVQDEHPPFSFVTVEGTAQLISNMDEVRRWAKRIGGRYMGGERADEYGARNAVPGELLVRISVERTLSARGVADW